ncbi:MAG: hypothetical protein V1915_00940 [Candidatus Bathyarchaeota archaeon]
MDAALIGEAIHAGRYLIDKYTEERIGQLSAEEAFALIHAKPDQGEDGFTKTVKNIISRRDIEGNR